jgi:MFS family permease
MAPESPRWLASQGKMGDTRKFLVKYHAGGIESSPLVEFEYAEITGTITRESQLAGTSSYTDMFRTKGNRHRLFISISLGVFSQWNGIGIVSYYFAPVLRDVGVKSVATQTMIAGFLQVWNIVFAIGGALLVDSIGRRKLFLTSCSGMLTTLILISVLSGIFSRTGKSAIGISVIPNYFLFSAFFDIAFTPLLYAYTCEIWPYGLRSRGLSTGMFTTSLAVFFNIFVNPIALDAIQWKYYIFYCGVLVVMLSVIWRYYPETSGHSLEEVSVIFDGEREAMQDN